MLKIYNTLSRKKETFIPINPGKVKMYVCGPTVYNYIHIGNARSAIAFDTIRRYFEFSGYDVDYVSNFTDVDDKMIKAANEQGITVAQLADKFINAFMEDTKAVNIEPATVNPRATENIPDIIEFIEALIDKGFAYEIDGDVYYRTRKFKNYGELSDQSIDDLEVGASQHVDAQEFDKKEDPIDFALWKTAKSDEISWESPWGAGRPGWHIECSVMSTKYLGDTFDVHGGGQDLEFPHHENEIAQTEARTGKKFANYWMHNGFVTVGDDNEKMSKSLGNFVTVHDIIQNIDPQVLRFFMATTQYRRPIQYNSLNIQDAQNNLAHIKNVFENLDYRLNDGQDGQDEQVETDINDFVSRYQEAMDDDFNVQNGIAVVYELVKYSNVYAERKVVIKSTIKLLQSTIKKLVAVFGIQLKVETLDDTEIMNLIAQRDQARVDKNFELSDKIRDDLKADGIIIEDTPNGTRYRKE